MLKNKQHVLEKIYILGAVNILENKKKAIRRPLRAISSYSRNTYDVEGR